MGLGEKLRDALEKLRNSSVIDQQTVKEAVKELQRALISADVEIETVLQLSKKIEAEAFKDLPKGITRREHIIKTTYDLLVELLGGGREVPQTPKKILMVGLYGAGKTTTIGKLGKYFSKRGLSVGTICADSFRAAAYEQLKQVCERADIEFFGNQKEKNAAKIVAEGLKKFAGKNLVIVDSAGRSALDDELVKEIKEVAKVFQPDQTWLVMPADIGQIAKKQAKAFHEAVGVNGVILTRLDGSAKGGGALAACSVTKAPVYFIGVGEKVLDLEEFDAQRYLSRIMGYGDLQALLEKVKEASVTEETMEELMKGDFNLRVFYEQLKAARQMGPLDKVMDMMGMKMQIPKDQLEIGEKKLGSFKFVIDSMTEAERRNPDLINKSRVDRIAKGSGRKAEEVRELLSHFKKMRKVWRQFHQMGKGAEQMDERGLKKIMQKFQGMGMKKKKFRLR